jgi:hypothetical protein
MSIGATGLQGATGLSGFRGATGLRGMTGVLIGMTGATGFAGSTGAKGPQGTQGATGVGGLMGNTGAQGTQGVQGETGETGLGLNTDTMTGLGVIYAQCGELTADSHFIYDPDGAGGNGELIISGKLTVDGVIDPTALILTQQSLNPHLDGPNDATLWMDTLGSLHVGDYLDLNQIGATGATGILGANGLMGSQGTTGLNGYAGASGAQGAQGSTGFTGSTGIRGNTGITGNLGVQGLSGFNGSTGLVGPAGATNLITGNTGQQGATGAQGNTGLTGTQGVTGFKGATGPSGLQGNTGFQGPTGVSISTSSHQIQLSLNDSNPVRTGTTWIFDTDMSLTERQITAYMNHSVMNPQTVTLKINQPAKLLAVGTDASGSYLSQLTQGRIYWQKHNSNELFGAQSNALLWTGTTWISCENATVSQSSPDLSFINNYINPSNDGGNGLCVSLAETQQPTLVLGSNGTSTLFFSLNGLYWTPLGNTIFSTACYGVAHNGLMWVAVGQGTNTVAWSLDGQNWTGLGTVVGLTSGRGIVWTGSQWLLVGLGGTHTLAYSTDGLTWTGLGNSIFSTAGYAIGWNGYLAVAVGTGTNSIAYSDVTGRTWIGVGTSILSTGLSVLWTGHEWYVGGTPNSNTVAWSQSGQVWSTFNPTLDPLDLTLTGFGLNSSGLHQIQFNRDLILALGQDTAGTLSYSLDRGDNWVSLGSTLFSTAGFSADYNGQAWVSSGQGASHSLGYSTDGINWFGLGLNTFDVSSNYVRWVQDLHLWIALGGTTKTTAWSYDGLYWFRPTNSVFSGGYGLGLVWNRKLGLLIAVGSGSTHSVATSTDGQTWTGLGLSVSGALCLGTSKTRLVIGATGANSLAYSDNGTTWTGLGNSTLTTVNAILWSETHQLWIAVGSKTASLLTIASSPDGINWSLNPTVNIFGVGGVGTSLCLHERGFLAGGSGGTYDFAYSLDGFTWVASSGPFPTTLITHGISTTANQPNIKLQSKLFIYGESQGSLYTSGDGGTTWTYCPLLYTDSGIIYQDTVVNVIEIDSMSIACGQNRLWSSINGLKWIEQPVPTLSTDFQLTWTGTYVVFLGTTDIAYTTPTDLLNQMWTTISISGASSLKCINWDGVQLLITDTTNGKVWTSTVSPPITWNLQATGVVTGCQSLVCGRNQDGPTGHSRIYVLTWILGGMADQNGIKYSIDGVTWSLGTITVNPGFTGCNRLIWNGYKFIANYDVALGTNIMIESADGVTWVSSPVLGYSLSNTQLGVATYWSAFLLYQGQNQELYTDLLSTHTILGNQIYGHDQVGPLIIPNRLTVKNHDILTLTAEVYQSGCHRIDVVLNPDDLS